MLTFVDNLLIYLLTFIQDILEQHLVKIIPLVYIWGSIDTRGT